MTVYCKILLDLPVKFPEYVAMINVEPVVFREYSTNKLFPEEVRMRLPRSPLYVSKYLLLLSGPSYTYLKYIRPQVVTRSAVIIYVLYEAQK